MIQAGFEFEFGHNVKFNIIKQILKQHYPNNKVYIINDDTDNVDEIVNIVSKNYFIFKTDTSVKVYDCKYKDTEMVTPVFIGKKAILENFKKIFDILKILNIKTDESCSVHINVSFSEESEVHKINLGKMYIFINELKQLKIFKRSNNVYCKPCMSYVRCKSIIHNTKNDNDIIKRLEKYLLLTAEEHHQAIAFDKIKNKELYITEFRFIGGNYINRFDDANSILNSVLDGMNFSIGKKTDIKLSRVLTLFKHYYKQLDI